MVIKTYYNIQYYIVNILEMLNNHSPTKQLLIMIVYPSQATTIFEDPMFPFISHDFYVSEKGQ
jgi:hypothetical protein